MARLIWTEPALADVEAIADYIALDKPDAAKRYVQQVFAAVERLARFPTCPTDKWLFRPAGYFIGLKAKTS